MVADADSLTEGARRLQPELLVVDLSLAGGRLGALLGELRQGAPRGRVLVLSDHDDPRLDALILSDGADGAVRKTALASDLAPAVDAVLAGRRFGGPEPRP
jgi:DNA-binding NarL/FixJ family response regulator